MADDLEIIRQIGAFAREARELTSSALAGQPAELTPELFDRKAHLFENMAASAERNPFLGKTHVEQCRAFAADARAKAAELRAASRAPEGDEEVTPM